MKFFIKNTSVGFIDHYETIEIETLAQLLEYIEKQKPHPVIILLDHNEWHSPTGTDIRGNWLEIYDDYRE